MPSPLATLTLAASLLLPPALSSTPWITAQDADIVIAGTIGTDDSIFSILCSVTTGEFWATYEAAGGSLADAPLALHFVFGDFIEMTDAWQPHRESGMIVTRTQRQVMTWIRSALDAETAWFRVEADGQPARTFATEGLRQAVEQMTRDCRGIGI
jgi:hypothetical protein